jgi:Fe2+ transport system protein FeoA
LILPPAADFHPLRAQGESLLLELGFVPVAGTTVICTAPVGDSIEYRTKGIAVALRRENAGTVLVEELRDE